MVDAGGVVIWLGSAREDLVRGTVPEMVHSYYPVELNTQEPATHADNVTLPVACYDLLLNPDEVRINHT